MTALFRRKRSEPEPPPKPPPELPSLAHLTGDGSQTIYVTGDAQRDTDRIRMLVESMREISSTDDPDELGGRASLGLAKTRNHVADPRYG